MAESYQKSLQARPEQILYASILEKIMYFGLLILLITFGVYALGLMKPFIPVSDISKFWSLNVSEYMHQAHAPHGWGWIWMIGYGDFLNFVPIAMLAGVTIICFLAIVPLLWKQNDKVYAVFSLLEAAILAVAASGILGSGGH
jgi:hypothetical protein